jgi:RNA polymerase sigma-70 factor (ECF subfamily)
MTEAELDRLVDAARAGGGWAFGRLWQELSPVVEAYVRARGARDPDDTTSEVFLAVFRAIDRFAGDGRAFRSWLFTIAHHKAVDSWRRGPATREFPTDEVEDGRSAPSAEDDAMARLSGSAVEDLLLRTLTPDQHAVLLLRVVAELTLEETSAVVGKPVGAVKALQHRALRRLRREIAGRPISQDEARAMTWMR